MRKFNLPLESFGIIEGNFYTYYLKDYSIDPDKGYGKGGFGFSYIDYEAKKYDNKVNVIEIKGRYVNPFGPFKKELYVSCGVLCGKYSYHLSFSDKFWEEFKVAELPKLMVNIIERLLDYIDGAPDEFEYDRWTNTVYVREEGKYRFYIGVDNIPDWAYK